MWIAVGLGIGAPLGVVMKSLPIGVGIGLAIGSGLTFTNPRRKS